MLILGVNAYHADSSACILRDGRLVGAVEEERFRRTKHWAGFPAKAIEYCLREARTELSDIEHVAINTDSRANLGRKVTYAFTRNPSLRLVLEKIRKRGKRLSIADRLAAMDGQTPFAGNIHHVEHHLAHLASCFYVSPFREAAVVSVDGFGDFSSGAWGIGRDEGIEVRSRVFFPHSLGVFYQAMTQYLGFPAYGDEYKVMGLAPYGRSERMDAMRDIVQSIEDGGYRLNLAYFRHHKHAIGYQWLDGEPRVGRLYSDLVQETLGPARQSGDPLTDTHRNIARSTQARYEEVFIAGINAAHNHCAVENLALAGGCAMNSVANGKIRDRTPFKNVYVQAAAGDAGGAIGAAVAVYHKVVPNGSRIRMDHAYWGPGYSTDEIQAVLEEKSNQLRDKRCATWIAQTQEQLCARIAESIAAGQVVGWFQGRMEWGPRALGNRSILADPRRSDMKDILNRKIKRRESFRPFAPSILREAVADWFAVDDDVPFMMKVYAIRPEKRAVIPAVTHVDGSGRLQTVRAETNPRFHALISAFCALTEVPMVLNTSFNENEPIVCTPAEALDCFIRTRMDVLVLGDAVIERGAG